jgi:hypothetical protein
VEKEKRDQRGIMGITTPPTPRNMWVDRKMNNFVERKITTEKKLVLNGISLTKSTGQFMKSIEPSFN